MKERLENIRDNGINEIESAKSLEELDEVRRNLTGKKSDLSLILKDMGSLSPEDKREIGMLITEIRNLFAEKLDSKNEELISLKSVLDKPIDLTIPGDEISGGCLHPITQMCYDLNDAFASLGFEVYSEDDISSEKYAFDNLNFAPDHPARQSMDTFWLEGTEELSAYITENGISENLVDIIIAPEYDYRIPDGGQKEPDEVNTIVVDGYFALKEYLKSNEILSNIYLTARQNERSPEVYNSIVEITVKTQEDSDAIKKLISYKNLCSNLSKLNLNENLIDEAAMKTLVKGNFSKLQYLDLSVNQLKVEGTRILSSKGILCISNFSIVLISSQISAIIDRFLILKKSILIKPNSSKCSIVY